MSLKILTHALENSRANAAELITLFVIADNADDTGLAVLTLGHICKRTRLKPGQAKRAIYGLRRNKELTVETEFGYTLSNGHCFYRILMNGKHE